MSRVTMWTCDGCGATHEGDQPGDWLIIEVQRAARTSGLFGRYHPVLSTFHICGVECPWAGKALNEKLLEVEPASVEDE